MTLYGRKRRPKDANAPVARGGSQTARVTTDTAKPTDPRQALQVVRPGRHPSQPAPTWHVRGEAEAIELAALLRKWGRHD